MTKIKVRKWNEFQHYKDRSPPWIKLHKKLLDDYAFHCLPDASAALAPKLWLLCSESEEGSIELDYEVIAFRVRRTVSEIQEALKPLIDSGFFNVEQVAISSLAGDKQGTILETEVETEVEGEDGQKPNPPSADLPDGLPNQEKPKQKEKKKPTSAIGIKKYLDECQAKGVDPIPRGDRVFEYAKNVGLPHEFLHLCWMEFVERMLEGGKRKKDWPAHFRNCVRSNWYKLWWITNNDNDDYQLTTTGMQAKRKHTRIAQ